jgi:hypothetical protein
VPIFRTLIFAAMSVSPVGVSVRSDRIGQRSRNEVSARASLSGRLLVYRV